MRKRKVVVVEDDAGIAAVEKIALEEAGEGYEVIVASALAAIELATSPVSMVDCIVLDLILPGIGGSEVLERLKDAVPVVICSAVPTDQIADAARRLGVTEIIEKPFHLDDLPAAVARAIAQREHE